MKVLLSVLLGLMLMTSLVGISYATPIVQPSQSSGDINACVYLKPNNPNYIALGCAGAAHQNGDETPPQDHCDVGRAGVDQLCCAGATPHNLQFSDIQTNPRICGPP